MSNSPHINDITELEFQSQVLDESHQTPVLVDFWAPWCAPCRNLAPLLERIVTGLSGAVRLVKVNTDEQQQLAVNFGIRSLPTVQLYKAGQMVEQFMGLRPEQAIRAMLEPYLNRATDTVLDHGIALIKRGAFDEALLHLGQALLDDPDNYQIHPALAMAMTMTGDHDGAAALLNNLPPDRQNLPEVTSLKMRLDFAEIARGAGPLEQLQGIVKSHPSDNKTRYELSALLVLSGDFEAALEELLAILRSDRGFREDAGRLAMLKVFSLLGGQGPLVSRYRSLMASALH